MSQWGGCLRRIRQCLRRLLEDELDEEAVGLFEADKLELAPGRRAYQQQQQQYPRAHANGHSASPPKSQQQAPASKQQKRPPHKKQLRAKDASYSESIIQDFRKEEIPTELAKLYDLQDIVGIGTTSKVYKCKRRARPDTFACKVIDKRRLNMEVEDKELLLEQLRKEIEILQRISHPNIVAFQEVVETADKIFVVMELVQGGELFEYLLDRGPLPEAAAVHIMRQVMSAIAYLHSQGVVHRDLKAENLLVVDPTDDFPIVKLIDFGFATILRHNLTGSFLGTGGYLAPEIRQQRLYSESVDIWACGVLLYLLLSCRLPFTAEVELLSHNRQQVERKFELAFLPESLWKGVSESVKNLLRRMLAPDPMRRFTAQQVIRHPWILYGPAADQRSNTRPPPPVPVPSPAAGGALKGVNGGMMRALLENPQESSGTGAGLLKGGQRGVGQQGGGRGVGLGNGSGAPTGSGHGVAAMAISPGAAAAAGTGGSSPGGAVVGATRALREAGDGGAIRHVRSSLNLERMHQPFHPPDASSAVMGGQLFYSRTPPAARRPPLRSSGAATMNGTGNDGGQQHPPSSSDALSAMPPPRRNPQKPAVLVSYLPQTLHNAVAGDLSSTSNLSMKYASMQQSLGQNGGGSKRPPFGAPAAVLLSPAAAP